MNGEQPTRAAWKTPELEATELLDDAVLHVANDLQHSIANIGHPVGMGLAPSNQICVAAARIIVARFKNAVLRAVEHERCRKWLPIDSAPEGNDTEGPFFDVIWVETGKRCIGCYREKGTVKLVHGYPAVWTTFIPQPTHWQPAPAPPEV